MNHQSHTKTNDFEGYSPFDMHEILYDTFGENSPIEILKMDESEYLKVPILNQLKYLLMLIEKKGTLKLTAKGYLPTGIVADIYSQGYLKDKMIERGISKLYKETDSNSINLTRILLELSGLIKKRANKLSLTHKGITLITDDAKLLQLIFKIFTTKFNWGYYDGYSEDNVGQLGFGFSLILLSQYGKQKRADEFYAKKYFKAFTQLVDNASPPNYGTLEEQLESCYSLRTFDRFLIYFGLINIESAENILGNSKIIKTDLYDKLIRCKPPKYS
ncbi:MAG: hypothetical protein QM504_03565 [Pseudomonadota bacterium]